MFPPRPFKLTGVRSSGGTDNSTFSGNPYDSSSSARFSSSSTLPSSTDAPDHPDVSRPLHDIPIPPPHSSFSLRAVGRTFSFGNKKPMRPSTPPLEELPSASMRERAMTASSASTATPPKLLESDFGLGGEDDDFSNVFETFRRKSPRLPESSPSPAVISSSVWAFFVPFVLRFLSWIKIDSLCLRTEKSSLRFLFKTCRYRSRRPASTRPGRSFHHLVQRTAVRREDTRMPSADESQTLFPLFLVKVCLHLPSCLLPPYRGTCPRQTLYLHFPPPRVAPSTDRSDRNMV